VSVLQIPQVGGGAEARWTTPLASSGPKPAARNGHSLCWDAEGGACLLFGGADDESHRCDVWRLSRQWVDEGVGAAAEGVAEASGEHAPSVESLVWKEMACTGVLPPPREMHVATVLPTRRQLLVHGGRSNETVLGDARVLCLRSWTWSNPVRTACGRVGHTAALLPSTIAHDAPSARLLLFGGFTGEGFANDLWEVAPDAAVRGEAAAYAQRATKGAPPARFAHCVAAVGARLLVFGGSTAAAELDDLVEMRMPS